MTDFQKYLQQMANQEQEALERAKASNAPQEVIDAIEKRKNSFEQQLKEDMNMSNITVYESNTKGKEAFVKEVLTPVVQQYGYSLASYTGEDGKDEKVWLFKRSNRTIGFVDDAQFAVDVTADGVTALFEDVLKRIGVIPETRGQRSLIKACLDYIQDGTEDSLEFLQIMRDELRMTDDEIEEYGKGYCLDTSAYED